MFYVVKKWIMSVFLHTLAPERRLVARWSGDEIKL